MQTLRRLQSSRTIVIGIAGYNIDAHICTATCSCFKAFDPPHRPQWQRQIALCERASEFPARQHHHRHGQLHAAREGTAVHVFPIIIAFIFPSCASLAPFVLNFSTVFFLKRGALHVAQCDTRQVAEDNFDDPNLLDFDLLLKNVTEIQAGQATQTPVYSFQHSKRTGFVSTPVPHSKVLIVEGTYALKAILRPVYDLAISVTGA